MQKKRIRDYGYTIGQLPTGPLNKITDVNGVTVGHTTLSEGSTQTGVTSIIPHPGNLFQDKIIAATHIFNGFGKSIGTLQIDELGTIESPILLTNTFSVGTCSDSLIDYMLEENPEIGNTTGTINPVVGECNDMTLNDIRTRKINGDHILGALNSATTDFEEGAVGGGTGLKTFGLKGGIGSSSRTISYPHGTYTIGVLVQSNCGKLENFTLNGDQLGQRIYLDNPNIKNEADKGSIMMIVATDLPVNSGQLKRIIKRTGVGLSRTGSYIGHGSGDIAIGFSTANQIKHHPNKKLQVQQHIHDNDIDLAFQATVDATEEAILNSMITAETITGRNGHTLYSLKEFQ